MKVAFKALFLALVSIHLSQGSTVYDRFCVRNLGCDTDFQDMILGVSLKWMNLLGKNLLWPDFCEETWFILVFFLTRYIHVSVHPDKEFRQSDKCKMIICCLEETQNRSYALEIFESSMKKKKLEWYFFCPLEWLRIETLEWPDVHFLYRLVFHNRLESTSCGKFL